MNGALEVRPGAMELLGVGEVDVLILVLAPVDNDGVADVETVLDTETDRVTLGSIMELEGIFDITEVKGVREWAAGSLEGAEGESMLADGRGVLAEALEKGGGTIVVDIEVHGLVLGLAELDSRGRLAEVEAERAGLHDDGDGGAPLH